MPFDLGDTARLEAECRTAAGTVTDATTVVLTITLPDGTTVTPAVTNPPSETGKYVHDYVTTVAGRHTVRWVFTDPACAHADVMDVREAAPPLLFSLADAKRQLQITTASADDDLRAVSEATTRAVEFFVGPVVRRTVTEVAHGRGDRMLLTTTPILSVTSITPIELGQLGIPVASIDSDAATGVLRRTDGLPFYSGPYRVEYMAGRAAVPANVSLAGQLILQHLWRTRLHQFRGALAGGGDDYLVTEPIPGLGYAIPNRAMQLLEPDRLPPGVA